MGRKRIDLTHQRFGRLLVVTLVDTDRAPAYKDYDSRFIWMCRCDCGKYAYLTASALRSKNTQSCGCYRRDVAKTRRQQWALEAKQQAMREVTA